MKMASRLIDLISKKTNLQVSTLFCLPLPLFCRATMPFCATKTSNFVVSHYFHGGIVVCACQRFFSRVHVRFYFFTAVYFHHADRQHFSFSHGTAAMKFSCFSSNEIRLLSCESLTLALSLLSNPRECKHQQ